MKNLILILSILFFLSCDSILDENPRDRYSDNVVWTDVNLAENYLKGCYRNLNIKNSWSGLMYLDGISDNIFFIHIFGTDIYLEGNITASSQGPFNSSFFQEINWKSMYSNIFALNTFLENIDNVLVEGDQNIASQVDVLKGEAMFLRAMCYARLVMTYGGVPIMKTKPNLGDEFSTITRSTFKESIDFISTECDNAANLLLTKDEMEMGRATKGAALALKSRVLLFAASDLTADGQASMPIVAYQNPNRQELWNAAKNAAEAVINIGTYSLSNMGAPDLSLVAENYFNFFKQKDLSNPEIIWGKMFRQDVGDSRQTNLQNGPNGNGNWGSNNPTQSLVNDYQMEDGSDFFDHFMINSAGEYVNISSKYLSNNPYDNREPRFYGSILYDGAKWQPRFSNLQDRDPIGVYDRRTRIITENGQVIQTVPGIDTRQGPVTPEDGGYTGYLAKKHLDDEIIGRDENNQNAWIEFRYAEILLNYAEALYELGDESNASKYLNMIRNRAGLPNYVGDLKEAIRHERRVELAFEQMRWFDLRRWKILDQVESVKGMTITETYDRIKDETNVVYKEIQVQNRNMTDNKLYWIPISFDEISRAPQLTQNPGY
ncbi:RagB/SusD family nutrient uptake outer membrane protein [Membranihabitans marinus]|uniref:RagB/SusD family nutrient uptake outer membrane protein n=1 Tax=Membranihabitans marinus TaxID=1227546 RepID=UPI001F20AF3F|nr:RagB/SusD family nutrient uptake outer membrane protein [Membranihabitans marinus]